MTESQQTAANSKNTEGNKRKRGIVASRVKLEQAMRIAGLKTQTSLAEKIADVEDLENVPRDMVNRVFRGLTVEPHTIERIAAVLDVEAYSLYLSSDELEQANQAAGKNATVNHPQAEPSTSKAGSSKTSSSKLNSSHSSNSANLIILAVLVTIIVTILWLVYARQA